MHYALLHLSEIHWLAERAFFDENNKFLAYFILSNSPPCKAAALLAASWG